MLVNMHMLGNKRMFNKYFDSFFLEFIHMRNTV